MKFKMFNNKRGFEISTIAGIAITFVVIAIVLSFGAKIVQDLQDDVDDGLNGSAFNATENGLASLEEFSSWLPTLALIVVAAVIIGIIVRYFAFR